MIIKYFFICLILILSLQTAYADVICSMHDYDKKNVDTLNPGDVAYFDVYLSDSKSKTVKWNMSVTMPTSNESLYKFTVKESGKVYYDVQYNMILLRLPVVIPENDYTEGTATFNYSSKLGKCSASVNIVKYVPPPLSLPDKTWTFNVENLSKKYEVMLTSYPNNNAFSIQFTPIEGNPYISINNFTFIQGNNMFDLTWLSNLHDNNTAFIECPTWDGGYIYQGQVIFCTISYVPSWFVFSEPFNFAVDDDFMTLMPDGTTVNP